MTATARDPIDAVFLYHDETKHHPHRYARSRGFMDWENQPDPFRSYDGAEVVSLDEVEPTPEPSWDDVVVRSVREPATVDRRSISRLLYDSLALSAWKEYGASRWSLRVNPSSGNLHPTEGYVVAGPGAGLGDAPAVYHYSPYRHALERRAVIGEAAWSGLTRGLPHGTILVGLTSIHWRESWKYGERAYRYCQHDAGHALAAVSLAASALGWAARLVDGWSDDQVGALLGVGSQRGAEAEHPDCLMVIDTSRGVSNGPSRTSGPSASGPLGLRERAGLVGEPNRLSVKHFPWPAIDRVAAACRRSEADSPLEGPVPGGDVVLPIARPGGNVSAREIIRQRRSAVAMDGETFLDAASWYAMLSRLLPGSGRVPFDALPWAPAIHPVLFVHRVEGVAPGLYALPRSEGAARRLRAATREEFAWERPAGCPDGVPLHLLVEGDCRDVAQEVSCHQEIASAGVFAVAMIAEFEPNLRRHGAWFYRALHWEAGAMGQVLYLEAEAAGMRGTGIGCYFDDAVHRVLGLDDRRFQDLYHFTVGGALDDPRLRTIPPYAHLRGEAEGGRS